MNTNQGRPQVEVNRGRESQWKGESGSLADAAHPPPSLQLDIM
jgi:hypothetical protein